jgi:hypothetical protein
MLERGFEGRISHYQRWIQAFVTPGSRRESLSNFQEEAKNFKI